jgi:hypothetical protein
MGRLIGAVLLGYVTLALLIFACFTVAYVVMGADRAFRPGVYDVSTLWVVMSIVVSFGAAVAGGWVARRIAGTATGPRVLAAVVVVLGVVMTLATMGGAPDAAGARPEGVAAMEAMQVARTPFWIMLLNPFIGALGVLLGGKALAGATRNEQPVAAPGETATR